MRFDVKTTPPRTIYNLINGLVAPRPIALVTTLSPEGRLNAAPFSSFNYLSHNPPILGFGVAAKNPTSAPAARPPAERQALVVPDPNKRSGDQIEIKDTARNIEQTGEYVVNVVTEDIARMMNLCGVNFPPEISEPEIAGFTIEPSLVVKVPRLKESHAAFECKLYETLKPGNAGSRIILGEVVAVYVDDPFVDPAGPYIKAEDLHSIGRMNGLSKYVRTRDAFFEVRRINYEEWQRGERG